MERSLAIRNLRDAKKAHVRWVSNAHALINDIELNEDALPMMPTDCQFGRWYYTEGQDLAALHGFLEIERPHKDLHLAYMRIFKLLVDASTPSILQRVLGKKRGKPAQVKLDEAKQVLVELERSSTQVVDCLHQMESDLLKMSDAEFKTRFSGSVAA